MSYRNLWLCILICLMDTCSFTIGSRRGIPKKEGKIVGGQPIDIETVPHQVILQKGFVFACGGSIISPKFVLSAAHCIPEMKSDENGLITDVDSYEVRIQTGVQEANAGGGTIYDVIKIIRHPAYSEVTLDNDIALFMVKEKFNFNKVTQPIKLAYKEPKDTEMSYVSGYGGQKPVPAWYRSEGLKWEQDSSIRKEVQDLRGAFFPIVNRPECIQIHKKYNDSVITENMICAGYPKGEKDPCSGDSGGPMTVDNRLAGIVSWGQGCATEGVPGVYTNIIKYLKWIDDSMQVMDSSKNRRENHLHLV